MPTLKPMLLLIGVVAGFAMMPAAQPQDDGVQPYFWPHRSIGIPVDVKRIGELPNKPTDLQLYYAVNRGAFQKGSKLPLNNMQQLEGGKRGFLFSADRDGDFEFTVQFVYSDGSVSPRADELTPQQRIVIDTTPPLVKIYPSNNGVEWVATDDNLDARGITLQCKWPTSTEWSTVTDRAFRATDRFAWQLQPGKVLEVRLLSRDRAGNEGLSPIVRIPPDGATGVGFPRPSAAGQEWLGGAGSNLPQARIDYVNTLKFDVDYSIQRMGRSGIQAAHLFSLRDQGKWEAVKRFPMQLNASDKEQTLSLPFEAKDDGTYGFYVIPESGAGRRAEDPKREDTPMVYVVVDTKAPYVKITGVQVKPGGTRGPLVEVTWESADPNLMPQPISLEWSPDKSATKWNEMKYRLDNNLTKTTGRFTWEVPDEKVWKFWVRARSVDKASNTGEFIWPQEVMVDLEQPSASIERVRGGNAPPVTPPTSPPGGSSGGGDPPGGGSETPPRIPNSGPPGLPKVPDAAGGNG